MVGGVAVVTHHQREKKVVPAGEVDPSWVGNTSRGVDNRRRVALVGVSDTSAGVRQRSANSSGDPTGCVWLRERASRAMRGVADRGGSERKRLQTSPEWGGCVWRAGWPLGRTSGLGGGNGGVQRTAGGVRR